MDYIAHIRAKDGEIQTVAEHLTQVQTGSEKNGNKIGFRYLAGLAGLLHDLGKNTNGFYNYIQEAVAHPEAPPRRGSVDHSTAGGRLLYRRYHQHATKFQDKLAAEWIANCIISHHQGLRDYLDPNSSSPFLERVACKTEGMEEYEQAVATFFEGRSEEEFDAYFAEAKREMEQALEVIRKEKLPPIVSSLLVKYLFSCLIDADRTNTQQFEEDHEPEPAIDSEAFFSRSYDKLIAEINSFEQAEDADHPINRLRSEMSAQCEAYAQQSSGIYTLSIPTGGGKTLASLRYALKHALLKGKERIIYIVPYTTIIEQNAKDIREILQEDDMILEHHSNVVDEIDPEEDEYDAYKEKIKLARDNWNRPIIFTTMVQFLNVFYAKGTRNARRMHQLANAVLIFDEVQSVPIKCVSLFNAALNFLSVIGNSSILLCTATQPALHYVKNKLHLPAQAEIIAKLNQVGKNFKRVELVDRTTPLGWDAEELADFVDKNLEEVNSVLVILNTKSAVRKFFAALEKANSSDSNIFLFHLSTNMCAAHRKAVLKEVKEALKLSKLEHGKKVICVSTQLIEAGVNISFECVIRSLAGLDSIAQAAGRCNRHGKDPIRKVYIIRSADETLTSLPEIRIGAENTQRLLTEFIEQPERFGRDLLSAAAMQVYFEYYYTQIENELNYYIPKLDKHMFDLLNKNQDYYEYYKKKHVQHPEILSRPAFATAEQYFEVISNSATSVIVPYDEVARKLILDLNGELDISELGELLHQSQQYVVNIYDPELKKLDKAGDVYPLFHGNILALRETAYSPLFGIEAKGEGVWSELMV